MIERHETLGKLESVHGIAPAYLQRAAIIIVVSFVFFLLMLLAFSARRNIGYFLLATAFLVVQLFTLFGWIRQRGAELKLYEKGFTYRKHICRWDDIESMEVKMVGDSKITCQITKTDGEKIVLTEAVHGTPAIAEKISEEMEKMQNA
jgi:hypothetical protein